MEYALFAATGVLVIVAATGVSRRIGVAAPLLLVAIGAALSYLPGAPEIHLESEWILLIVLPPLLYAASFNFPAIDFRRNLAPIAALGVVLVIVSALLVGLLLWWLLPQLDLASAIALGAVLSPTDAVSATSIAKRIGLPSRIVTILEGESLINDASALVLMRTAVAGVATAINLPRAVGNFFWATFAAIVVGAIVGLIAVRVRSRFRDTVLTTSISFAIPFFAYIPAEAIEASGVIAVVTAGLIVGNRSVRTQTVQLRFAEQTNWKTVQFLLENGVFLVMGYQVREYIDGVSADHYSVIGTTLLGLLAVLALVVIRLGFTFPLFAVLRRRSESIAAGRRRSLLTLGVVWLARRIAAVRRRASGVDWSARLARREEADRRFHARERLGWRSSAVIGWSGMRGVVTVAAVQALPDDTPYRSALVLIAFTAAVATLLLGGLTLPGLARMLGVGETPAKSLDEVRSIFGDLAGAAHDLLADPGLTRADGTSYSREAIDRIAAELDSQTAAAMRTAPAAAGDDPQLRELRLAVYQAQREALADARATSDYGTTALGNAAAILNSLEARASEG